MVVVFIGSGTSWIGLFGFGFSVRVGLVFFGLGFGFLRVGLDLVFVGFG